MVNLNVAGTAMMANQRRVSSQSRDLKSRDVFKYIKPKNFFFRKSLMV